MTTQKQQLQLELLDIRQKLRSCDLFNQVRLAWSIHWGQKAVSQRDLMESDVDVEKSRIHERIKDSIGTASNHIRLMEDTLDEMHMLHAREKEIVKYLMEHYEVEGSELL